MSYTDTRARSSDPQTSKDAAKAAARDKANMQRAMITRAICQFDFSGSGWTAKDIARNFDDIPLADAYRRLPECAGIKPHETMRRDGCRVWVKA